MAVIRQVFLTSIIFNLVLFTLTFSDDDQIEYVIHSLEELSKKPYFSDSIFSSNRFYQKLRKAQEKEPSKRIHDLVTTIRRPMSEHISMDKLRRQLRSLDDYDWEQRYDLVEVYRKVKPYRQQTSYMTYKEMLDYFKSLNHQVPVDVSVLGVTFSRDKMYNYFMPLTLLFIYIFLLVHLKNFRVDKDLEKNDLAFIPLYQDLLSRILSTLLLNILPVYIFFWNIAFRLSNPELLLSRNYWLICGGLILLVLIFINLRLRKIKTEITELG